MLGNIYKACAWGCIAEVIQKRGLGFGFLKEIVHCVFNTSQLVLSLPVPPNRLASWAFLWLALATAYPFVVATVAFVYLDLLHAHTSLFFFLCALLCFGLGSSIGATVFNTLFATV